MTEEPTDDPEEADGPRRHRHGPNMLVGPPEELTASNLGTVLQNRADALRMTLSLGMERPKREEDGRLLDALAELATLAAVEDPMRFRIFARLHVRGPSPDPMMILDQIEPLCHAETSKPLQRLLDDALEKPQDSPVRALQLASWAVLGVELRLRPFFLSLHRCLDILESNGNATVEEIHQEMLSRYFNRNRANEYYGNEQREHTAVVNFHKARRRFEKKVEDPDDSLQLSDETIHALDRLVKESRHDPTPPEDREDGKSYRFDVSSLRDNIAHGNLGVQQGGDVYLATSKIYSDYLTARGGEEATRQLSRMSPEDLEEEAEDLAHLDSIAKAWEQLLCLLDTWISTKVLSDPYPPESSPTDSFTSMVGFLEAMGEAES